MKKKTRLADPSHAGWFASARHHQALTQAAVSEGVWQACFDGSALGGLGRMAIGGVLYAPSGEVHELAQALPGQGCNNEAEYRAVIVVLEALERLGARRVHIWGDSDLVVRQLRGEHLDKAARLTGLREQMLGLARRLEAVEVTWVPRHRNGRADALAAVALKRQVP